MARTEQFTDSLGRSAIRYLEDDTDLGIAAGSEVLNLRECAGCEDEESAPHAADCARTPELATAAQDRTTASRHPLGYGVILELTYGNVAIQVQDDGRHHATIRSEALRLTRAALGDDWHICAYLGPAHYRTTDGYPRTARRFSVVRIAA